MPNVPSPFQAAVYADVARGLGHTVVRARAGSGKTTTIMGALSSVPAGLSVALFAFNKSIACELERRAPKSVQVKTLHSHGFAACRRAFGRVTLDDEKSLTIAKELFGPAVRKDPVRGRYSEIRKLVSKAKDVLVPLNSESALFAKLDRLVDEFDVDAPEEVYERQAFVEAAGRVLLRSKEILNVVDFSDMCWLPLVINGADVWRFDRVFVDETQDLSPAQIQLLLRSVKRNGRICAVGDDMQAIYAFRGADVETIPKLIQALDAKVLPLSVTYRCCTKVVDLARKVVPDLEAAPNAPEGRIDSVRDADMVVGAQPGDMVISRTNAPLSRYCLALLKQGTRAVIKGKDIGAGLLKLVERSKASSVDAFLVWLEQWTEKEIERLEKRDRPIGPTQDRYGCLVALAQDMPSIEALKERIERLFSDKDDSAVVTLGTTHKLKGLEAERVWMLHETYHAESGGEEANCWYVAVTRAKTELLMVTMTEEVES